MDKAHWLRRKAASIEMARGAAGSVAKLIHYDLAGRYSLKAASAEAETSGSDPAPTAEGSTDFERRIRSKRPVQAAAHDRVEPAEDADDRIDRMVRESVRLHGA